MLFELVVVVGFVEVGGLDVVFMLVVDYDDVLCVVGLFLFFVVVVGVFVC